MIGALTYAEFFTSMVVGWIAAEMILSRRRWMRRVGWTVLGLVLAGGLMYLSYQIGVQSTLDRVDTEGQEKVCI